MPCGHPASNETLVVLVDACRSAHGSEGGLQSDADSDARPRRRRYVPRQVGRVQRQEDVRAVAGRVLSRVQLRRSTTVGGRRRLHV